MTYWLLSLAVWPALFGLVFAISQLFGSPLDSDGLARFEDVSIVGKSLAFVVFMVLAWLSICVEVKRWHDRNKSGWWWWIGLVPVIGPFWVLAECGFRRGTSGPNQYGADPLAKPSDRGNLPRPINSL